MRPLQLHGHGRPLTIVKYNREGDLIFSAARDKSPNVWYSQTGELLGSYDGHNGAVFDLDVDYNTERLITGSGDNTARLWDVKTGQSMHQWEFKTSVRSVQFSLGDRSALILTESRKDIPGVLNIFPIVSLDQERKLVF